MALPAVLAVGSELIKRLIPDENEQIKAQAELLRAEQAGEFKQIDAQLATITAEAKSKSWLTSAARPAFMWVMYIMILISIPIGFAYIWAPEEVGKGIEGMQLWLNSIPTDMWALFGAGYLGYTTNRSADKARLIGKEPGKGLLSKIFG